MDLDTPLTNRQAVIITSRGICVLLLLNAIVNLSSFPGYLGSLLHYLKDERPLHSDSAYFFGMYLRNLAAATIRLAIELFFALWFYRADRGPLSFLLKEKL